MFERLKKLYREGNSQGVKLTKAQLQKAVEKGWITREQYKEIVKGD